MRRQAVLVAVLVLLAGCGGGSDPHRASRTGGRSQSSGDDSSQENASSLGDSVAGNGGSSASCTARNTGSEPDLLERLKDPGLPFMTQQLPGGYAYNEAEGTCQTSIAFTLSTVADEPGYCIQIAKLADNPRYDVLKTPSPPLAKVVASKGVC